MDKKRTKWTVPPKVSLPITHLTIGGCVDISLIRDSFVRSFQNTCVNHLESARGEE